MQIIFLTVLFLKFNLVLATLKKKQKKLGNEKIDELVNLFHRNHCLQLLLIVNFVFIIFANRKLVWLSANYFVFASSLQVVSIFFIYTIKKN